MFEEASSQVEKCFIKHQFNSKMKKSTLMPNFVSHPIGITFDCRRNSFINQLIEFVFSAPYALLSGTGTTSQSPDFKIVHRCYVRRSNKSKNLSKRWRTAITLKMLLIAWDLWAYKIGFGVNSVNFVIQRSYTSYNRKAR